VFFIEDADSLTGIEQGPGAISSVRLSFRLNHTRVQELAVTGYLNFEASQLRLHVGQSGSRASNDASKRG
jgi:hypothetical protein